jgi:COP9 signalosome complex subunit 7
MDPAGLNSGAKLEPFLLMAKNAKGAAAAKLIADATAAPGVFVFGELLALPAVQDVRLRVRDAEALLNPRYMQLANHEQHAPALRLLELFAYRTYGDYLRASLGASVGS